MLIALGLVAVLALILANGAFVAAEFAYVAAKRGRLEDEAATGNRRARRAVRVHQRLSFMLSGAQLGITVTSLVVGFIAEPAIGQAIEPLLGWIGLPESSRFGVALTIAFVLATAAQMVLGELAPKNLAIARPEAIARAMAGPTWWFMILVGPLIRLFDGAANRLLAAIGIEAVEELHGTVSTEELDLIVEESAEQGKLSGSQASLLSRAIEFGSLRASAAMVPWNRVTTVPVTLTADQLRLLIPNTYSRFPVLRGDGSLTGVVHVKDLLQVDDDRLSEVTVAELAHAVAVVPEAATLQVVLNALRREATEMAVVIDEYGAPAGLVTLEDLVEELVGDINDEYDPADQRPITVDPDGGWLVAGDARIDEVERATGLELPDDDGYDTVAGLFLARQQRIPEVGESIEIASISLEVVAMEGWAITMLRLEANEPATSDRQLQADNPSTADSQVPAERHDDGDAR